MLIAVIDNNPVSRRKIVQQFSRRDDIRIFCSVDSVSKFRLSLTKYAPFLPDILLVKDELQKDLCVLEDNGKDFHIICYQIGKHGNMLIINYQKPENNQNQKSSGIDISVFLIEFLNRPSFKSNPPEESETKVNEQATGIKLSIRELQVISGLLIGSTYAEVATNMSVSINTVRKYVKDIYRKEGVKSRIQLILKHQVNRDVNSFEAPLIK